MTKLSTNKSYGIDRNIMKLLVNLIYRLLLTFNATSLIIVIYLVKEQCVLFTGYSNWFSYTFYALVPILLTLISIWLSRFLTEDNLVSKNDQDAIIQVEQANNAFLPSYLGYFFVAVSVDYFETLIFVFIILFVFTYLSQTLYFNPLFLLFGFNFYYVTTFKNVKIFLITRKQLKVPQGLSLKTLRRINDYTFIQNKKD